MQTENNVKGLTPTTHTVKINGVDMHYLEQGKGDPILFLHGIPTSSYLWRNVLPHTAPLGRCIAPDLIGFGQSKQPGKAYTLAEHCQSIVQLITALDLDRITLVMHGYGALIGLHYAMQHEKNCKGLVFYEAFLRAQSANDVALPFYEQLSTWQQKISSTSNANMIDDILRQCTMHDLGPQVLQHYHQAFTQPGSDKILRQYLAELSAGAQGKIEQEIARCADWLMQTSLPKLLLYSVPGFVTTMETVIWAKDQLPNIEIAEIGEEMHLAQESHPEIMGQLISAWLQGVEQMSPYRK